MNVIFNDINLNDYCKILNVSRSILPNRTNNSKSVPIMNGSYYTGYKYAERVIDVEILIEETDKTKLLNRMKELGSVLNTDKPVKIVCSDEPDRYVYGVLDGATDLESLTSFAGKITISFLCNNPIIYSDKWQSFTPNTRGVIAVENVSNLDGSLLVNVNFNNPSPFLQLTSFSGDTVLLGKMTDLSQPTLTNNDIICEDNCQSLANFTQLSNSLLPTDYIGNGQFGVGINGDAIVATNIGSGDTDQTRWHGAAFKRSLSRSAESFQAEVDFIFTTDKVKVIHPPTPPTPLPPTAPPPTPENPSPNCYGEYKVVNCGGLWINREPNTKHPIYAMSPNTIIYPTEIKNGWAKHTHKAKYGTYTGWSSMKYLKKISGGKMAVKSEKELRDLEKQIGTIEVYGYGKNGENVFLFEFYDTNEWAEYVNPRFKVKGTEVIYENSLSGKNKGNSNGQTLGRWYGFDGKIVIRREKLSSGKYAWTVTLNKIIDGKIVASLSNSNAVITENDVPLSYLGFFIGGLRQYTPYAVAGIKNIVVKDLKQINIPDVNVELFQAGDNVEIDFSEGSVVCNGVSIMENVDIGSNFFEIPQGTTNIVVKSDDPNMSVVAGLRELYM